MTNIVERCDNPTHSKEWVHDCDTGTIFYVPPGWEWTGQPNGAIVRKAVKKNG